MYQRLMRKPLEKVINIYSSCGLILPEVDVSTRHAYKHWLVKRILKENSNGRLQTS